MVLWCWKGVEPKAIPGVVMKTHQGIPNIDDILGIDREGHCLIVCFDDLFDSLSKLQNTQMSDFISLVVEHSRKREIGLIITVQQLFTDSYCLRTYFRNLTWLILYPFRGDEEGTKRYIDAHEVFFKHLKTNHNKSFFSD